MTHFKTILDIPEGSNTTLAGLMFEHVETYNLE